MDSKEFYKKVEKFLKDGPGGLMDKFKLDSSDLINAVKNVDQEEVARALNSWVDPNKRDGLNRIALPHAVDTNDTLIVGMLLHKGAEPNVLGLDGESPLYKAVFWENKQIISLLLIANADIKFKNKDGRTPVDIAQESGYTSISELLEKANNDRNRKILEKETATHNRLKAKAAAAKIQREKAAQEKEKKNIEKRQHALLKKYPNAISNPLESLLLAIKNHDSKSVKDFTEKVDNLNKTIDNISPLLAALHQKHEKLTIFFIKAGANPLLEDNEGITPFHIAIQNKMYHVVEYIVDHFDTKNVLNHPNQLLSPLFLSYKDLKMVNLLLKGGADPTWGGKEGTPFVIKAIEKGSIGILPILDLYKVDLNQIINGKSILEWAITHNRIDWVNGLIEEGVDLTAKNSKGETIQEFAKQFKNDDLMKMLE